jgi:hypothetical protein
MSTVSLDLVGTLFWMLRVLTIVLGLALCYINLRSSYRSKVRTFKWLRLGLGICSLIYSIGYFTWSIGAWGHDYPSEFGSTFILPINTIFLTFVLILSYVHWQVGDR